jgi:hypothetical protein
MKSSYARLGEAGPEARTRAVVLARQHANSGMGRHLPGAGPASSGLQACRTRQDVGGAGRLSEPYGPQRGLAAVSKTTADPGELLNRGTILRRRVGGLQ